MGMQERWLSEHPSVHSNRIINGEVKMRGFLPRVPLGFGRRAGSAPRPLLLPLLAALAAVTSLLATAPSAAAQETGTIVGQVIHEATGRGLSGVQVVLLGTEIGTLTNSDGRFVIPGVRPGSYVLEAVMIGYAGEAESLEVVLDRPTVVQLRLRERPVALDGIVVTGTPGTARQREVGNSIAVVDEAALQVKPVQSLSQVLQAEVPGLMQLSGTGQVGGGSQITLRGINSVTQGTAPLIYVDGVRITDQRGPGPTGAQQMMSPLDAINPADIQRIEVIKGAAATTLYGTEANSGVIQIFTKRGTSTDPVWKIEMGGGGNIMTGNALGPVVGSHETLLNMKPFLRTGGIGSLSGSVSGGSGGVTYFLSGEYSYQAGVFPDQDTRRAGFRTNLGFEPVDALQVQLNAAYSRRYTNWLQAGDNASGVLSNLLRSPFNNMAGADSLLWNQDTNSSQNQMVGGVTLTYSPGGSISSRASFGLSWIEGLDDTTRPQGFPTAPTGMRDSSFWRTLTLTSDFAATWSVDLPRNVSSALSAGFQVYQEDYHQVSGSAENFPGFGVDQTLASGSFTQSVENVTRETNTGFFLQEVIGFRDRLFVTGGIRFDGNNAFGDDLGFQAYPKLSATYVLSDHEVWPDWWEVMKLRGAVGESGKAPGPFDALRTWGSVSGYENRPAITPRTLGDPNLGPERTREYEAGFDAGLLDDRIGASFTWYRSTTTDLLLGVSLPPSLGFYDAQIRNVGELKNQGVELDVEVTALRRSDLTWTLGLSGMWNENEGVDFGGESIVLGGAAFKSYAREGFPVPSYFGFKVTNPNEVADPVFAEDAYLGAQYPTRNWGVRNTLNLFDRFTIYGLLEGAGGHYIMNTIARQNHVRQTWPGCNDRQDTMDQQTAIWRARCAVNPTHELWVEPADYVKLRSLSVSYDLPERMVFGASSARLTLSGQNLWKWTDYDGLDPELTRSDRGIERREYYHIPASPSFRLTLAATF